MPFGAGLILHGCGQIERDEIGERVRVARPGGGRFAQARRVREDLGKGEVGGLARRSLQIGEGRDVFRHRIGNVELAFILKHQDSHGRDGFRHRGDPEQRVGLHRFSGRDVGQPARLEMQNLVLGHDHRDRAGDLACVNRGLHRRADTR